MEESFELPVTYNGRETTFESRLVIQGYTHKFCIVVGEAEVVYERDEEGSYRALIANPDAVKGKLPEGGLLAAIGEKIQFIVA